MCKIARQTSPRQPFWQPRGGIEGLCNKTTSGSDAMYRVRRNGARHLTLSKKLAAPKWCESVSNVQLQPRFRHLRARDIRRWDMRKEKGAWIQDVVYLNGVAKGCERSIVRERRAVQDWSRHGRDQDRGGNSGSS